jgi:hypothetical protein
MSRSARGTKVVTVTRALRFSFSADCTGGVLKIHKRSKSFYKAQSRSWRSGAVDGMILALTVDLLMNFQRILDQYIGIM